MEDLEKLIGEAMGWTYYDPVEDAISPFAGMWVGVDGKTGHDIKGLVKALTEWRDKAVVAARLEELQTIKDALNEITLKPTLKPIVVKSLQVLREYCDLRSQEINGNGVKDD